MSSETLGLRRQIFEAACNDLGIKFVFVTAPDPTSDVGVAGAQQYILEQTPQWIEQYGKNTVFFCTNDAHTEPLLKQLFSLAATKKPHSRRHKAPRPLRPARPITSVW
jgi:DNA-binding LacI/PurR family transcriptional regulator